MNNMTRRQDEIVARIRSVRPRSLRGSGAQLNQFKKELGEDC